jgi:hypothetical protein
MGCNSEKLVIDYFKTIIASQENGEGKLELTTVGGVTASRDKQAAIQMLVDALCLNNDDVSFYFDQIK